MQCCADAGPGGDARIHQVGAVDGQLTHCVAAGLGKLVHAAGKAFNLGAAGRDLRCRGVGVQIGVFQHTEPPQEDRPAAVQQLEDARIVGGQRGIMDGDQPHRAVREVGGGLEAAQDRAGSLRPPLVVPLEMRRAIGADCAALRLGNVVQKGGPAQHPHAAGVLPAQVKCGHSGGRMLPHIVAVPPPRLGAADAGQDLRHYAAQNLAVLRKRFPGAGKTLAQYGEILGGVVPEILPCIGCTQPGRWHCYDVWQHSAAAVAALDLRGQDTRGVRVLCWATFLHDIAKPQCRTVGPDGAAHFKGHNQRGAQAARTILRRLKAPAYLTDGAVGLIAVHDAPLPADDAGILKLLNRSGAIFLRRLCVLKYADLDAHAATPEVAARRAEVERFACRMDELAKTGCYTMRQLAVNGADLMDAGIPAGPGVGATLQTLLTAVMEGRLPNEREALLEAATV